MHRVYKENFRIPGLCLVIAYLYLIILDDILKVQQWTMKGL